MNLTKEEILKKKFKKNVKGYDPLEVDEMLDLIIKDYKEYDGEIKDLKNEIINLRRDLEGSKAIIREKDKIISIDKSKLEAQEKSKYYSSSEIDPIDLLKKCSKYEVKLAELGVDPSKIK